MLGHTWESGDISRTDFDPYLADFQACDWSKPSILDCDWSAALELSHRTTSDKLLARLAITNYSQVISQAAPVQIRDMDT